ncbi:hypothetical protein [Candidatus Protochlamydia phocaeensis]|uniref:hypothetical protein n=1 Tax=Candidatus Protochlamydia phocaeensis TaxID=1414722 RepID=UPI000837C180|nr:hypothetical protein [Candidatus Protochlamydia phocaeensis]
MAERSKMIEDDLAIRLPTHDILSTPVLIEAVKFYAYHGKEIKNKIDQIAAEVTQRQEKMKFLHEIVQELNSSIDGSDKLDIGKNEQLKEKLRIAKEMGVNIPLDSKSSDTNVIVKTSFSSTERDRLLENLHLTADTWDKENKQQTQKMQIYIQESDRYLMLANQVLKYEDKPKRSALSGIKGS